MGSANRKASFERHQFEEEMRARAGGLKHAASGTPERAPVLPTEGLSKVSSMALSMALSMGEREGGRYRGLEGMKEEREETTNKK